MTSATSACQASTDLCDPGASASRGVGPLPFPTVIDGRGRPLASLDVERARATILSDGAIILRGWSDVTVESFQSAASRVSDGLMRYWLGGRARHSSDDTIQGVDPGNGAIFPHSEMSYMPFAKPDLAFFWVKRPCERGGRTILVDGCRVPPRLAERVRQTMMQSRVTWSGRWPYEKLQRMCGVADREGAERILSLFRIAARARFGVDIDIDLMDSEFDYAIRIPALHRSERGVAYADHWASCHRTLASAGSARRFAFSDGAWLLPLQERLRSAVASCAVRPRWFVDDVAIIDNWTVLHGREAFPLDAERVVLSTFGYAQWLTPVHRLRGDEAGPVGSSP